MGHSVASNVMCYGRTIDSAQSVGHNKVPLVFHSVRCGVVMVMSSLAVLTVKEINIKNFVQSSEEILNFCPSLMYKFYNPTRFQDLILEAFGRLTYLVKRLTFGLLSPFHLFFW